MTTLDEHARAGIAAVNEGQLEEAIQQFQSALAIDSERPDLNNALGMAYLRRGEVVSALPHLRKAVDLGRAFTAPEHDAMRRHFAQGLASAHTLLDQIDEAIEVLKDAVDTWPMDLETRMQLGSVMVNALRPADGRDVYQSVADEPSFEEEIREAAGALAGAITAFLDDEELQARVFLQGHCESYIGFFNQHANGLIEEGWYAEAARMVRGPDGEPKPVLAEGARPWALERVDLVNPADGNIAKVGDEKEPLIIAVNGLEPLAQVPVTLPWTGWDFEVWVCSRCPWHWLSVGIQLQDDLDESAAKALDEVLGAWYLAGYNGDFGESDTGRFHYATDLEPVGTTGLVGVFDLGRAKMDAIDDLLKRLTILHDRHPIRRVLFGQGRLPA